MHMFGMLYAQDLDAYTPELWANETLLQLEDNFVYAGLVYRDFSNDIAKYGDIVNAQRPGLFYAQRMATTSTSVPIQEASVTNVQVKLNHMAQVTFAIRDGERSYSFQDLITTYMTPAARAIAKYIDEIIAAKVYEFETARVGALGTDLSYATAVDARTKLNNAQCPLEDRSFVLSPDSEGAALKIDKWSDADKSGDMGAAIRAAYLGSKAGFNLYMNQNTPSVPLGSTRVTGAVNMAAGAAVGATSITCDGLSAALTNGSFVTIAGEDRPHRIVSSTGGATPTAFLIDTPLEKAVADNAVIYIYTPGAVNLVAGYAAGYAGTIIVDGFTVAPKQGQLIAFGTSATTARYKITQSSSLDPSTTLISLDRPLDAAIADDAAVCVGPSGNYNFAFHRNAIALVSRPLAIPRAGQGVEAAVASYKGVSMRVTMGYDITTKQSIVSFDVLCGVQVLDTRLGCQVLA